MKKTRILFISDLHLCPNRAERTALFIQFLSHEAQNADALYILGDLFDIWIGDDDINSFSEPIIHKLNQFTKNGTPCYFIRGNHDFLAGKRMSQMTGMTLLDDPTVLHYGNQRYLLSHGDAFCLADKAHQRYRNFYLKPSIQFLFMTLPKTIRHTIARRIRTNSEHKSLNKSDYSGDIDHSLCLNSVVQHQCDAFIHGHTHRPTIDTLSSQQNSCTRITLPAWENQPGYLEIDANNNIHLNYLDHLD